MVNGSLEDEQIFPTRAPQGSQAVALWAAGRGIAHTLRPDQSWFRAWEPYQTMVSPSCYLNACGWPAQPGHLAIAEPWTEEGELDPMERALLGFAQHPGLRGSASARVGEHFITRVAFIDRPPPPVVQLSDATWDANVVTRAPCAAEAAALFHPELRAWLARHAFRGHLELRPGGLVVHWAGLVPIPEHYEELTRTLPRLVTVALGHAGR